MLFPYRYLSKFKVPILLETDIGIPGLGISIHVPAPFRGMMVMGKVASMKGLRLLMADLSSSMMTSKSAISSGAKNWTCKSSKYAVVLSATCILISVQKKPISYDIFKVKSS